MLPIRLGFLSGYPKKLPGIGIWDSGSRKNSIPKPTLFPMFNGGSIIIPIFKNIQ